MTANVEKKMLMNELLMVGATIGSQPNNKVTSNYFVN